MNAAIFVTLLFAGVAFAGGVEEGESIIVRNDWPENPFSLGGGIVSMIFENLDDGICIVTLPSDVNLFHVMNGHIVPGDVTNPIEGRYKIAAPAHWEATNGTFNVLILFSRGDIFNLTDIKFRCDVNEVADISVYSFPQNNLIGEASSNVYYRPGFHVGDVLTITLPAPVERFNFTTMDSAYEVTFDGSTSYTLSGFKNPEGVDQMKEVHFSINYEDSAGDGANWFSAGDVTVTIEKEEVEAEA